MLVNVANFGGPNSNGYEDIQLSSMGGRGGRASNVPSGLNKVKNPHCS